MGAANPTESLELYDRLVATQPGTLRKGVKLPYTSLNGHMYSFLTETGVLALRLGPADRRQFIEQYETGLHQAMNGTILKEYVTIPGRLLADTNALAPWFAKSFAYVASLKPKPTTRRTNA